jgi:hypothetical protein
VVTQSLARPLRSDTSVIQGLPKRSTPSSSLLEIAAMMVECI